MGQDFAYTEPPLSNDRKEINLSDTKPYDGKECNFVTSGTYIDTQGED